MAAVVLKAALRLIMLNFAAVAGDAALMALGQVVDGPAEGGMAPEEVDVPARQVQNVEVGDQLPQTLLVKEYVDF